MTPKSLLRHPLTACTSTDLTEGHFHTVLEQKHNKIEESKVKRLVLTTGKMAIDIAAEAESRKEYSNSNEVHVIRIEQLYPFPKEKVEVIVQRYPYLEEIVWVQEEPKNMGAWYFVFPILSELASGKVTVSYIGRPDRSSPAGGDPTVHKEEQEQIIQQALNMNQLLDKETHKRVLVHS
jgi:2-oxoglutarate dehydrogenase E1 component